ncbi:hypothetical protein [Nonomuraea recticatena]|uniref:Uncharacterized protein n=1 Tax=Nonomuraea recticatena TaxID=46178 RepID=A0ABP6FG02_9ACTN
MIVTVALLRAALAALNAYDWHTPLPVMVSSPTDAWARPLASTIRFGHFKTIESDDHLVPVGSLTRDPSDGPAVAALTMANPDTDPTASDIRKAPTTAQLAKSLAYAGLVDATLPVVIPTDRIDDDGLYSPIDPVMDHRYYDPDGDDHFGVWADDAWHRDTVHVLWPLHPRRAAQPAVPIRPVDWLTHLHQTETWIDPYGRAQPLRNMEIYDTCMARAWLEINADVITNDVIQHIFGTPDTALAAEPARPTPLQEAARALPDPRAWITSTPLAKALFRAYA